MCTNNVREWEPHWRAKLPIDEIFETVVDSGVRRRAQARPARSTRSCSSGSGCPRPSASFVDDIARNVEAAAALGFARVHFRDTAQAIAELDALLDATG